MRILTAPVISLGLGASLRLAHDVPWDVLLRVVVVVTIALWVTAVAVTLWCVFAPCGEDDSTPHSAAAVPRRSIAS